MINAKGIAKKNSSLFTQLGVAEPRITVSLQKNSNGDVLQNVSCSNHLI